jgi:hypothetical protein
MQPSNGLALASLLGTIQGLYPQARVTSTYRGPNNPLTRRNPSSLHAQGSPEDPRAVDIAPIPGVTFDQYRAAVGAKVPLAQAFDEASHPFPWTTGPNWHLAQGQAPKMAARPKPRTLADIAAPSMSAMPVGLASAPVASPMTLADLALPQGDIPQKKASKFTAGNILGVLGDALMAYGGLPPQFGPNLAHQRDEERQMDFDREKFNALLQQKREEALAPPSWLQDAMTFQNLPQPQRDAVLGYQDAVHPAAQRWRQRGQCKPDVSGADAGPRAEQHGQALQNQER